MWHLASSCFTCTHVDVKESATILFRVDREESVLALFKPRNIIKMGCLCELALGIVAPSVVSAAEHSRGSRRLLGHGERTMAADIMECPHSAVLSQHEEDAEACNVKGDVVPGLDEAAAMAHANPNLSKSEQASVGPVKAHLAKYGTLLGLESLGICPPSLGKIGPLGEELNIRKCRRW